MKCSYDLHVHSILSPCGDVLNTPNNIMNMAMLKNLDFIAVTDHNTLKQLQVLHTVGSGLDPLILPGCECTVVEGFHVLAYFKDLESALQFDSAIEQYIEKKSFDEIFYGEQIITDIYDCTRWKYPYLLSNPLQLNINELIKLIKKWNGLVYLAHVDRSSNSGFDYLINHPTLDIDGIEFTSILNREIFIKKYPFLTNYRYLINSDAHCIVNINEAEHFIDLPEKTVEALWMELKRDE